MADLGSMIQAFCNVREAQEKDASAIARLAEQLGYPTPVSEVRERLALLRSDAGKNQVLLACAADETVLGWVHVVLHLSLVSEPRAEVTGLVVDEKARGVGVGRQLMDAAESWARELRLSLVRLSSQTKRVDAHRFYEHLGYEIKKTSHVLTKRLDP